MSMVIRTSRLELVPVTLEIVEADLHRRDELPALLRAEIGDARISAEVPFVLSVRGTMIRGSIDLLVERADGSVLVVDYKTNRLDDRLPEALAARYSVQRDLYALAAAGRGKGIETAYVFLERPDAAVMTRFEAADLDAAGVRIEALVERLADGHFEVTEHPHRDLCLDCPARERLCSHATADQLRDSPDPPVHPAGAVANGGDPLPGEAEEPQLRLLEGS